MNTNEKTCPDCGTEVGQPHRGECDVERCSVCGCQRLTCNCKGHDPTKSAWTGEWPPERHHRTVQVTCDLRGVLQMAAEESSVVRTCLEMGILTVLDELADRAAHVDPETRRILRILELDSAMEDQHRHAC